MEKMTECMQSNGKTCCERHTWRNAEEKKKLLARLRRIEGQIRGLEKW